MTGKLTISPEHDSLPSVQRRSRHAEDACGGLHGRKRSSKDFYPPLMAFIRDRLHIRMKSMETSAQMIEEENILDNYKELEKNEFALMVWELMNGTKERDIPQTHTAKLTAAHIYEHNNLLISTVRLVLVYEATVTQSSFL
ncbi:unnamed protein product [Menidia menidia]|uniref:(Atlantic silverside) hypothetical protein n=1 Tax=Menidia menidia TaxID=238744 RepID=A0A8S4B4Z9_9TELE|nr:unnamed protein product [Menidia menidia]